MPKEAVADWKSEDVASNVPIKKCAEEMSMLLRESIKDWVDWDWAGYCLAVSLGMMPEGIMQSRAKGVFWSNNPIGNMLYDILDALVAEGVLEVRDEPDRQYRWNPEFRGQWE